MPCLAAALLYAHVSEVSTLMTAHSTGAAGLCVHSVIGEGREEVALSGDALLEEAAEDKAIVVSSAWLGVAGGVWKKSKGEPE